MEQMMHDPNMIGQMPTMIDRYGSSISKLTNPTDLLDQIEMNLLSKYEDEDGVLKDIPGSEPLVNIKGAKAIRTLISSTVAQNTIMSNLQKEDEINRIMQILIETLVEMLMVNKDNYEIEDDNARNRIMQICLIPCKMTMLRSFKQGERGFWKGSVTEIVNKQQAQNQSFLSRINPFS